MNERKSGSLRSTAKEETTFIFGLEALDDDAADGFGTAGCEDGNWHCGNVQMLLRGLNELKKSLREVENPKRMQAPGEGWA